jgi:hypothetical protein
LTTNYKEGGIYLPPDDRRHYVAWSNLTAESFPDDYWRTLYGWYADGGIGHVCAWLRQYDICDFDSAAPPTKTAAFKAIVAADLTPEDAMVADAVDRLGNPRATTLERVKYKADSDLIEWLQEAKDRRKIGFRFGQCGYEAVQNPDAKDGQWRINGKRQTVYALKTLSFRDQLAAAEELQR